MYEDTTYEGILKRMLGRVSNKLDKREGSVIYDTHSPAAVELQILYLELDGILREAYGDTASREFLILRCRERGIEPYAATNAVLLGEFAPASIDVEGRRFNIGSMNYISTKRIEPGKYQMECEQPGAIGNKYLGDMVPIEYLDGLESAQLTGVLIPGEDDEDTEALRARYFASFDAQAFGGNRKDYIGKADAIAGVGCTKVTPVWNAGVPPSSMIPSAAVTAWYESAIGGIGEEAAAWLSSVYTAASEKKLTTGGTVKLTILDSDYNKASGALIEKVQSEIDPREMAGEGSGCAPIGHVVSVGSAEESAIRVTTSLDFESGYGWANMQDSINGAIESYLLELRKEWAGGPFLILRISQIETRLLSLRGVVDVRGTRINGSEENLALGSFEIPVFGGASE